MNNKILRVLVVSFITALIFLSNDRILIGEIYFYVALGWLIVDIVINKKVELIHVWVGAFVFIILSEVFSPKFPTNEYTTAALKYLIFANNIVYVAYYLTNVKKKKLKRSSDTVVNMQNKLAHFILLSLLVFYFAFRIQGALLSFTIGRIRAANLIEESLLLATVLNALGFLLPAVIAYYYLYIKRTKIIVPLLFSLPVFFILFLYGSRFPLLFSFLGFGIVAQNRLFKKLTVRTYLYGLLFMGVLVVATIIMRQIRGGVTDINDAQLVNEVATDKSLPYLVSSYMSPEGVLDMTSLLLLHFQSNNHLYGQSTGFLAYFWVPRSIWADKPDMLGYWFVRLYRTGFGKSFSASFGFTGDLYADFGKFSLLFVAFYGFFLRKAEAFKNQKFKNGGFEIVIAAMLYPCIFFFVRSPITSTMNFLSILLIYHFFKYIIFKKLNRNV